MTMNLLLDTGILGQLCHPSRQENQPVAQWLQSLLTTRSNVQIFLPEIADYELRRKLLHLIRNGQASSKSIGRLDDLGKLLDYLPLDSETMRRAAELWAESRSQGKPTSAEQAIDGDVILAAQALAVKATVVTTNRKHLSRFVPAKEYFEIQTA
jgi:predicted nucleic acid-binding protein